MFRIIIANWRRYVWMHLVAWPICFVVLRLMVLHLSQSQCAECDLDILSTKYLFMSLLFGQGPLVLWVQFQGRACYTHQKLTDILPLSLYGLNLTRIMTGAAFLVVSAVPWTVTLVLWRGAGMALTVWVPVFTALATVLFLLIGMRNLFPRVLIPVLVPLITIPGSERFLSAPLEWITWPQTSLVLGLITLTFGWWVLRQPPPQWAR